MYFQKKFNKTLMTSNDYDKNLKIYHSLYEFSEYNIKLIFHRIERKLRRFQHNLEIIIETDKEIIQSMFKNIDITKFKNNNFIYKSKTNKNRKIIIKSINKINDIMIQISDINIKSIDEYNIGKNNNIVFSKYNNYMDLYLPSNKKSDTAIVYCNGGYFINSNEENENVKYLAESFNKKGYSFFSLNYTVQTLNSNVNLSNPLELNMNLNYYKAVYQSCKDLFDALTYIKKMGVKKVVCMGFSSGAIMSLVTLIDTYPFLSMENPHRDFVKGVISIAGTLDSNEFLGAPPNNKFNIIKYIDKKSPPSLLWHGDNDIIVPKNGVIGIKKKYDELDKKEECKLFLLEKIGHGESINATKDNKNIVDYSLDFIKNLVK